MQGLFIDNSIGQRYAREDSLRDQVRITSRVDSDLARRAFQPPAYLANIVLFQ
jgi:hypothetical protein